MIKDKKTFTLGPGYIKHLKTFLKAKVPLVFILMVILRIKLREKLVLNPYAAGG